MKIRHRLFAIVLILLLSPMTANAVPIFSNFDVVTAPTNTATFDGISGSLLGYTEDGLVVSVDDNYCCFSSAHYGSGGNFSWVTISLASGDSLNALDFLLGNGWSSGGFSGFSTNLIWETFSGVTSTGFGDVVVNVGSTVGWADVDGFTSLRVAAHRSNINLFGQFQAIALDNVRASSAEVPEPSSLALLGISLFGMGLLRRKKA